MSSMRLENPQNGDHVYQLYRWRNRGVIVKAGVNESTVLWIDGSWSELANNLLMDYDALVAGKRMVLRAHEARQRHLLDLYRAWGEELGTL